MESCGGYSPIPKSQKDWTWRPSRVPIHWSFDCSFPENLRDDVRYGFDHWEDLVDGLSFIEDECDTYVQIIVSHKLEMRITDGRKVYAHASRFKHPNEGMGLLFVNIIYWEEWFVNGQTTRRSVSMHEVGHAVGLKHEPKESCIMHDYIKSSEGLKETCKEELEKIRFIYERR